VFDVFNLSSVKVTLNIIERNPGKEKLTISLYSTTLFLKIVVWELQIFAFCRNTQDISESAQNFRNSVRFSRGALWKFQLRSECHSVFFSLNVQNECGVVCKYRKVLKVIKFLLSPYSLTATCNVLTASE
jgi:hypothetical protein